MLRDTPEFIEEDCPDCQGEGIRHGRFCEFCRGRGIIETRNTMYNDVELDRRKREIQGDFEESEEEDDET